MENINNSNSEAQVQTALSGQESTNELVQTANDSVVNPDTNVNESQGQVQITKQKVGDPVEDAESAWESEMDNLLSQDEDQTLSAQSNDSQIDPNEGLDPIERQLANEENELKAQAQEKQIESQLNDPVEGVQTEQEKSVHEEDPTQEESTVENENKPNRFRLKPANDVDTVAMEIKKRNPDLTLEESVFRAKEQLGLNETESEGENQNQIDPFEAIESEISRLEEDKLKALEEDFDYKKSIEIDKLIRKQERKLENLEDSVEVEQRASDDAKISEFNAKFDDSQAKAVDQYDFVTQPNSKLAQEMVRIDNELEASGDPIFFHPDKPLIIAQRVASNFGIVPRSKAPVQNPNQSDNRSPVQVNRSVAPTPASASQRTANTNTTQQNKSLEDVQSEDDWENFHATL